MKIEQAKEKLSKARDVNEWNLIRESVKAELTPEELGNIDGSGFITTVSESNKWPKSRS